MKGFGNGEKWRRKKKTEGAKRQLTGPTCEHRRHLCGFPDTEKGGFGSGSAGFGELQQEGCSRTKESHRGRSSTIRAVAVAAGAREAEASSLDSIKDSASLAVWGGEGVDTEVCARRVVGKLTQLAPRSQGLRA